MMNLNQRSLERLNSLESSADQLAIRFIVNSDHSRTVDFGVEATGGLAAGLELARICTAGLASVDLVGPHGGSLSVPLVQVHTDQPLLACMGSQYGGWQLQHQDFFAIGSGPMRLARGREPVLETYNLAALESQVVGVLESASFPDSQVFGQIAADCQVDPFAVTLCVARTGSLAGSIQIVARSAEATMHKLFELDVDLRRVHSICGSAPLPPISADDLVAIGRTNDAILYGAQVVMWIDLPDDEIRQLGPRIPSDSSSEYGKPFADIFRQSGGDFYKLDPMLFSAAEVTVISIVSGHAFRFGQRRADILEQSFFGVNSAQA